ncbi:MAG: hypothetical protein AUJ92_21300 [Armatimonadetes bacterium CG2_30_59_28]|nr:NAD(P)-dependent oxidoreductase [Armatimonadota bacterium]OIO89500.1 MAG: hypothetical protein AUJ92_21300 [Armatimonadetes bacterium CG2_30_59_28]PIU61632.1 MAG: hypothetical protein COS85_20530 [Armatimonadetes bacterium CG07_land_8_20_14_0_80_59_28]PIX42596.1 MAG: hypothetical protein COZ56_09005 [Armatimonadetes bacterium CG_4_8_14_3_um_filter_58_9]PIY38308.1 MAG: hypothetical protein COZ05_20940 [Armatimonadetes bacterium CG_4_10_14_3_um_filter_59_10]PJB67315.1 MAG: hypothetical protei
MDEFRVLVTGAAGHLGSHVVAELVKDGFAVRGWDIADPPSSVSDACEVAKVDLTDADAVQEGLDGADVIVHCASIHPWKKYTDAQYVDANVKGTWNLYAQAADVGVNKIVLTSSIAATGYGNIPASACPVKEDQVFPLGDLYSFTKHAQEDIARLFADKGLIQTIALRPPAFMPKPNLQTGFSLTAAYAVVDDVTAAHVAAVRVLAGMWEPPEPLARFEAFYITNRVPYGTEDLVELEKDRDLRPLVKMHWPNAYDWLIERGYEGGWLPGVYDLSKAKRLLNWSPMYNFDEWFEQETGRSAK